MGQEIQVLLEGEVLGAEVLSDAVLNPPLDLKQNSDILRQHLKQRGRSMCACV